MENLKSFFESFKEFIWDIIGYLLPGSYLLILLSVCINQNYFMAAPNNIFTDFYPYIFIVISYLLGHATYGLGLLKEELLGDNSYLKKIEIEIKNRKAFVLSKDILSKTLISKGRDGDLSNATVREVRNIIMSFIPEYDQKIYGFMFRSEVSNQSGNISILIGILGLFFSIFNCAPANPFISDIPHITLYIILIIIYIFLRKTRNRFYAIAIGLPFSIYTANSIK